MRNGETAGGNSGEKRLNMNSRIKRIQEMEQYLDESRRAADALAEALTSYEAARKGYKKLSDYYGSARWMGDYEADEAGKLPRDLKRGVLSEDGAYDALTDSRRLLADMRELAKEEE